MAFIDMANITSAGMPVGIRRLNFSGLVKVLTKGLSNVGVFGYIVNRGFRQGLFREMEHHGIRVEAVSPGKSVDGRLIFGMLVGAQRDQYDVAVLASGDKDYHRTIQEVKSLKKQVYVASFSSSMAPSLEAIADQYIKLDDHIDEISIPMQTTLYKATCANCGNACEVPFKPLQGRPVYCQKCYERRI
jgi:CxxC-x17-CxxC domain-containing protein